MSCIAGVVLIEKRERLLDCDAVEVGLSAYDWYHKPAQKMRKRLSLATAVEEKEVRREEENGIFGSALDTYAIDARRKHHFVFLSYYVIAIRVPSMFVILNS